MLKSFRNALIGALVLGFAGTALAQDPEAGDVAPVEEESSAGLEGETAEVGGGGKPISVGLLLGYGISFEDGNPWGLGFGLRGGYNIDAIFLGARFIYYLGQSEEAFGVEISSNIIELGIEGGYDIAVGPVIIRPGLGLGLAIVSAEVSGQSILGPATTGSDSSTNPYIALGGSVLYDIDEQFFVGGDMRLQFVIGDGGDGTALIILANGGMRF
jgi:hypothetical protein